jgi:hypothetical protein
MFRVGLTTNKGRIEARDFATRSEADDWLLSFDKDEIVLRYRIQNEKGELIETEKGVCK